MLQFALEPLLLGPGAGSLGASTLPAIAKILRTLKHTQDITQDPQTANIHVLCDLALAIAKVCSWPCLPC